MDHRPLYMRVHATLVDRLMAGEWHPGSVIPSEIALAKELKVSQGTVRKAIDQLCADGALRRVQGRGTFVSEQTPELAHFRFFRLVDEDDNLAIPQLYRQIGSKQPVPDDVGEELAIAPGSEVHVIQRIRTIGGERAISETVTVPVDIMPGLSAEAPLPNALYPHYQATFGVTVLRTEDRLSAVNADERIAKRLSVAAGTALLRADRLAFDLTDRCVEHRVTFFITRGHRFQVTLR